MALAFCNFHGLGVPEQALGGAHLGFGSVKPSVCFADIYRSQVGSPFPMWSAGGSVAPLTRECWKNTSQKG